MSEKSLKGKIPGKKHIGIQKSEREETNKVLPGLVNYLKTRSISLFSKFSSAFLLVFVKTCTQIRT